MIFIHSCQALKACMVAERARCAKSKKSPRKKNLLEKRKSYLSWSCFFQYHHVSTQPAAVGAKLSRSVGCLVFTESVTE